MDSEKIQEILFRENLRVAPLSKRILAYLIDDLLIALVFFAMFYSQISSAKDAIEITAILGNLSFYMVILRFFYQSLFTRLYGASIGKLMVKIKIVQVDTLDTPNFLNAVVRSFFKEVGQLLLYITYFFAINDPLVRTLHDRIIKSIVIIQD